MRDFEACFNHSYSKVFNYLSLSGICDVYGLLKGPIYALTSDPLKYVCRKIDIKIFTLCKLKLTSNQERDTGSSILWTSVEMSFSILIVVKIGSVVSLSCPISLWTTLLV